jgi:hypothetical protein
MRRQSFLAIALLTAFPVVSLFAANADQVAAREALRSLLVTVLGGWLVLLAMSRLAGDWSRATLLTAGFVVLFFTYGQVYDLVEGLTLGGVILGRHRWLFPVWGLAGGLWLYWVAIRGRHRSFAVTPLLAVGTVLVAIPLISVAAQALSALRSEPMLPAPVSAQLSPSPGTGLPDIYYIIVDGYGRSDVLKDLYGIDNSGFINFLESRGFFVASEARSNYSKTVLSLASSLNMRYLDDVIRSQGVDSTNRQPLIRMIQNSDVRRTLEAAGYGTVGFQTGYPPTELTDASLYFAPPADASSGAAFGWAPRGVNEFEILLLQTTALRPAIDKFTEDQSLTLALISQPYLIHRRRILFTLERLPEIARMDGRTFTFAHILVPHPPFVFGRDGEEVVPTQPFRLMDIGTYPRPEYIEHYRSQLLYVDTLLEKTIDQILSDSSTPPIIILQGDHGPGAYMDYQAPLTSNTRDRMSILNAYLVPPEIASHLYASITPVNSFRVLLDVLLGESRPLLPDESYFTLDDSRLYDMINVTDRARSD